MSKKDINEKYADAAERASSGDLNNIELKEGQNAVRIVDLDFQEVFVHFVDDTEGDTKKIVCPADIKNRKTAAEICPVCAEFKETKDTEIRAQHRYYFNAVQGTIEKIKKQTSEGKKTVRRIVLDNVVKLWDIGPMIFNQIAAIQMDDEIPDLDKINLKITRTGTGKKTEYQVLPSPKETKLPEDLTELIDLEELVQVTPIDEINRILGNEVAEDLEDDEVEDKKDKKSGKKKSDDEEDLEDLDDTDDEKKDEEDLEDLEELDD